MDYSKQRFAHYLLLLTFTLHRLLHAFGTTNNASKHRKRNLEERTRSNQYEVVNNQELVFIGTGNLNSLPDEAHYKNALSFGFMFNIKAIRTIELTQIDFYVDGFQQGEEVDFEAFQIHGGFLEYVEGMQPLTSIASGKQSTNGTISIDVDDYMLTKSDIIGIYITLKTQNLLFSSTESNYNKKVGQAYEQNLDAALLTVSNQITLLTVL